MNSLPMSVTYAMFIFRDGQPLFAIEMYTHVRYICDILDNYNIHIEGL
jgi:hypothetical protein